MLVLGHLINVFETPKGVTKDGKRSTAANQRFRSCMKTRWQTAKNAQRWRL